MSVEMRLEVEEVVLAAVGDPHASRTVLHCERCPIIITLPLALLARWGWLAPGQLKDDCWVSCVGAGGAVLLRRA